MSRLMHMIISKHPSSGTLYSGVSVMVFESSMFRMIIFGSVRILPLKNNKIIKKKDSNRSKLTGSGSVWVRFLRSKTRKTCGYYGYSYNVVIGLYL